MRALFQASTLAALAALFSGCSHTPARGPEDPRLHFASETRLANLRELTSTGRTSRPRWSFDGSRLVLEHAGTWPAPTPPGTECDQTFSMETDGSGVRLLSSGKGRTQGGFFLPDDDRALFSGTFAPTSPPGTEPEGCFTEPAPSSYQLYSVKKDGSDLLGLEPGAPRAYNSEAAVCKDGSVVFTSDRDGDPELYRGKLDRLNTLTEVARITHLEGYDGEAAFSPDCKHLAWTRDRGAVKGQGLRPQATEIWVAAVDGSQPRQLTHLGARSRAPVFLPDGERILFASNARETHTKTDLYLIRVDGTGLERVSFGEGLDTEPAFSPDGRTLAFVSSRGGASGEGPHLFLADWLEKSRAETSEAAEQNPENRFKALVDQLSSKELGGRALGTPGLTKAENLVAERFLEAGLKPEPGAPSFAQKIEMAVGATSQVVAAHNIVGHWGQACGKQAPIVVGAHLDHLGNGGPRSPEPSQQGFHPGADSNASGVAAMIEVARAIQASGAAEAKSCFLFVAFTGEESGIAGSSRFVAQLKNLKIRPKAMFNLDMVGRLEANRLIVFGTESAKEWSSLLAPACTNEGLHCEESGDGYGPSDELAFELAGVPALHFFTGTHADYHRTTDTSEKINATGAVQIARVAAAVAMAAASPRQPLHFLKGAAAAVELPAPGAEKQGRGSYLGTIPDYSAISTPHMPGDGSVPDNGVRLAGTHPGSPAARAGLKAGDILTGIDARKVRTLEDFMHVLADLNPGDSVTIHLRRGAQNLNLPAEIGKRGN